MSNISRCVRHHALRDPGSIALAYSWQTVSYGALWRRINAVAGLLRGRGVQAGDRVALLMKNSPAFLEALFAASHIGAVAVPINFRLARDEVDYILHDSGAVLLLRDEEFAGCPPPVRGVIDVHSSAQLDLSSICSTFADEPMAAVDAATLMRIMYTSGTTDHPKGVMLTHGNFYAKSADQIIELGLSSRTRLLVVGPLYHVGALDLPGIAVLWAGGMLSIQRDFDAAGALDLISQQSLNAAWLAPVMAARLMATQAEAPRDVTTLEWVIAGGERTPEARIREFGNLFPNARYIDAYGLTETCGGDTLMERGREIAKIGSVGRPLSQVDVEIRDDAGCSLAAGKEGEVCVRGAKVTTGYWNAPEKTAASFHGDWLRTGDVGFLDEEGFLFLTDRKKDLIISGGENIASSEVERAIQELNAIQDVAVVGMPDPVWGERPVAFVVVRPQDGISAEQIQAHCRSRLAAFKVPDRVIFETALPRTASGKVLKRELRKTLLEA